MHTSLYDMYDSGEEVINNGYEIERLMELDPSELVTMINEEFGSEMNIDYNIHEDVYHIIDKVYDYEYTYDVNGFLSMVEDMLYDLDHETVVKLTEKYC